MERSPRRRLIRFLLACLALTLVGVLAQRPFDGVLRVEGWAAEIRAAAAAAGLPEAELLAGLVYAESRGRADAESSIGAIGLCQLLPTTADELVARHPVEDPAAPAANLLLGAHYLAEQIAAHGGDERLGLLAYRLGPGTVARRIAEAGGAEAWLDRLRGRKPSAWEYVVQIERFRERFRERGRFLPEQDSPR
jgi:soluble lytic murein transglycosylase-like protein